MMGYNDIFVCNGVNRDVTNLDFMDFFANDVNQKMVLTGKKESVDNILKEIPRTPLPNKVFRNDGNLKFKMQLSTGGFLNLLGAMALPMATLMMMAILTWLSTTKMGRLLCIKTIASAKTSTITSAYC